MGLPASLAAWLSYRNGHEIRANTHLTTVAGKAAKTAAAVAGKAAQTAEDTTRSAAVVAQDTTATLGQVAERVNGRLEELLRENRALREANAALGAARPPAPRP